MDVGVGSFSDPEGLEGLAHFLGNGFPILPLVFYLFDMYFLISYFFSKSDLFAVGDPRM